MSPSQKILLTSASGNIGRVLIPLLLRTTTATLILPTSSATRLQSTLQKLIPPTISPSDLQTRLIIPEGPISDPLFLSSLCATRSPTSIFLNTTGSDELPTTLNALTAFARAPSVEHVVYLSCAGEFTSPGGMAEFLRYYGGSASVVTKVAVEARLLHGDPGEFKWSVVGPTLFFENDLRTKELLLRGEGEGGGYLPEPLGEKGVSRVSCADVALAVAKCLEDGGERLGGRKVNVGSLRRFTGTEIEGLWTKSLGREVRMGKGDEEGWRAYEEVWEGVVGGAVGRAVGRDASGMSRGWCERGYGLSEGEYRFCRAVLGREVGGYEEWVGEMGRRLLGEDGVGE